MSQRRHYGFIFCVLMVTVVISFQNCGYQFKISDLSEPLSSVAPNETNNSSNSADTKFFFDVGPLESVFQSESVDLKVEFQNSTQIKSLTIHSESDTAQEGIEFVSIQKNTDSRRNRKKKFHNRGANALQRGGIELQILFSDF